MSEKADNKKKISVGDRFFVFDSNNTRYVNDPSIPERERYSYASGWVEVEITAIGRRYITYAQVFKDQIGLGRPVQVDIKFADRTFHTAQSRDNSTYQYHNAIPVSELVRKLDADTLRKVAELIGFKEIVDPLHLQNKG